MLTTSQILDSPAGQPDGAEDIPYGLYSFVPDASGRWLLEGGRYNEAGLVEATNPAKVSTGRKGDVFLIVRHNSSGREYNLSFTALKEALKARTFDFGNYTDLRQTVEEKADGRLKVTVDFLPPQ